MRRLMAVVVAASALAAACSGGAERRPERRPEGRPEGRPEAAVPLPRAIAAMGDSITRAFVLCERGGGDCPEASWSTGTEVDSHLRRLRATGATVEAFNVAVSGATVASLEDQAKAAARTGADYVTILIGANDACAPSEAAMTPVAEYAAAFERALATLVEGLPKARVLVLSVPDLMRLWEVGHGVERVRETWRRLGICESMLARPTSTEPEDVARRERVRDRVVAYNAAMAAACARHRTCRWDGNAVHDYRFGLEALSPIDYWHPSREGQRVIADLSWRAGFWPAGQRDS